jgi:hypothetical protein
MILLTTVSGERLPGRRDDRKMGAPDASPDRNDRTHPIEPEKAPM